MEAASLTFVLAGAGSMIFTVLVLMTFRARTLSVASTDQGGRVWRRSYHLASELCAGRNVEPNSNMLIEFLDETEDLCVASGALAVAVREHGTEASPAFFAAVGRSSLAAGLRRQLGEDDDLAKIEALEVIEVLRLDELLGDAAVLARHHNAAVVRAACDAITEIDPSVGVSVLIGRAHSGETWVLDGLGRAVDIQRRRGDKAIPLSRSRWRDAPVLAQRAVSESIFFDRATVNDAIATLVGNLESSSSAKRLAAVSALAACVDHQGAQLALAGALGADDRMTRFAAAAGLSDSVIGRSILQRAAAEPEGSDAARMASEVLWHHRVGDDGNSLTIAS